MTASAAAAAAAKGSSNTDAISVEAYTLTMAAAAAAAPAKGSSKTDPISVETYTLKQIKAIDLGGDDDAKHLDSVSEGSSSSSSSKHQSKKPETPRTFMCEICFDSKPYTVLFRVSACNHSYCSDCMVNFVASKLQDNISAINCPAIGCKGFLEPHQCRSILPNSVFDRWGDALCEAVILASERLYCPFKDCSALLVSDGELNGSIMESECPYCHRLFCAQCKVRWHSGVGCDEYQKLNKEERNSEDIMLMNLAKEKEWMRCSKCRFYVERSSGCVYIRCRCGHSFCYKCGDPMGKDHFCKKCNLVWT